MTPNSLLVHGDARRIPLPDGSVSCCVTSPPYWGAVRDYGVAAQIGHESEPSDYAAVLVAVFRDVARVLRDDGSLWLNLGDVYAASGRGGGGNRGDRTCWSSISGRTRFRMPPPGYKQKDLTLAPFLVANALRQDGWYLRSTVIWRKLSAVEPTRLDRPSVAHEYLFLLVKSEQYRARNPDEPWWNTSVWSIGPDGESPHPATMPRELARRCIVASTVPGDIVFDPFVGSGTSIVVANALGRRGVGLDLSLEYLGQSKRRLERPHAVPLRPGRPEPMPLFDGGEPC